MYNSQLTSVTHSFYKTQQEKKQRKIGNDDKGDNSYWTIFSFDLKTQGSHLNVDLYDVSDERIVYKNLL